MSSNATSDRVPGGRVGVLLMQDPGEAVAELQHIASGLARAGITVRCLQPAASCNDAPNGTRWWDWYAIAEAALADMRRDCDVVIVGGLSTGAALGLLLAANHPEEVQGTVLFAPTMWLSGRLAPWAARLVCTALGRRVAEAVGISPWLSHGPGIPADDLAEHRRLLQAARRELKAISQPALIIHSRADRCAGLDSIGYLQRNLRGLVDMVVLGGSHQAASDFIVEKAQRFIEGVARRPQRAFVHRRTGAGAVAAIPAVQVA